MMQTTKFLLALLLTCMAAFAGFAIGAILVAR